MAQRAYPIAVDSSTTAWTAVASYGGATVPGVVDESPFSGADYARGTVLSYLVLTEAITFDLSEITDPTVDTGFSFNLMASFLETGASKLVEVVPKLYEDASLIWTGDAEFIPGNSYGGFFDGSLSWDIPNTDIAGISDFSILKGRVEFTMSLLGVGGSWQPQVAGLYVGAPDAGFDHLDIAPNSRGFLTVGNASGHYLVRGPGRSWTRVAGVESTGALYLDSGVVKEHA